MFNKELVIQILGKIEFAIERILSGSPEIASPQHYLS